jgi:Protein of unknown function, DUF488
MSPEVTELRKWFGHDPAKFAEFRPRYLAEPTEPGPRGALGRLRPLAAEGPVALLTATSDVSHRHAAVLAGIPCQDPRRESAATAPATEDRAGGEAACRAHLVCPHCGAVVSEGHHPDCTLGPPPSPARQSTGKLARTSKAGGPGGG